MATAVLGGCFKMDKTPPTNLPAYVKLYPGSTQVMNMSLAGVTGGRRHHHGHAGHGDDLLPQPGLGHGLTETATPASAQTGASAGQQQANFTDPSGKMLLVVAKPQSSLTLVTLTWKTPPARGS